MKKQHSSKLFLSSHIIMLRPWHPQIFAEVCSSYSGISPLMESFVVILICIFQFNFHTQRELGFHTKFHSIACRTTLRSTLLILMANCMLVFQLCLFETNLVDMCRQAVALVLGVQSGSSQTDVEALS